LSAANISTFPKEFVLFLALILGLLFLGVSLPIPIISTLAVALVPVPITIFCLRNDLIYGAILLLALLTILSLWGGPLFGIIFLFEFGFLSLALALGFKYKFSQGKIISTALIINIAAALLLLGILILQQGIKPRQILDQHIESQIQEMAKIYNELKLDETQREALTKGAQSLKKFILMVYPGLYISMALCLVVFDYLIIRWGLIRLGYMVADRTPFSRLLIPETWVWGLIASVCPWMFGIPRINTWALNATIVFLSIYILQGLAIGIFLWTNQRMAPLFKLLVAGIILFQPLLLLLLFPLGLFDIWIDFRKLKPAQT
jgi:hypothetical protein